MTTKQGHGLRVHVARSLRGRGLTTQSWDFFWLARREREDRTYARLVKAAVGVTGGQKGHRGSDPPAKFSSLDLNRSDLNLTLTSWGGSGDKRVYGRNILKRSPGLLDQPQLSTAHSSRPDKDGQLDGVERHQ